LNLQRQLTNDTMKTRITLLTLAVASLSALAADVTGTWKAEFETQRGLQKYTFNLKQDGANVTGKASVEMTDQKRDAEFKEGKVDGDTVTFVEPLDFMGMLINISYTGKIVSDDQIDFSDIPERTDYNGPVYIGLFPGPGTKKSVTIRIDEDIVPCIILAFRRSARLDGVPASA
jgi:hypothetical protein